MISGQVVVQAVCTWSLLSDEPSCKPSAPAAGAVTSARAVFLPLVTRTSCLGVWAATLSNVKADSHFFSPLRLIQVFIPEEGSCLSCCRFTGLMAEGSGKCVGGKGNAEQVSA